MSSADRPFEAPFRQDDDPQRDRLLCRSPNYTVRSAWEEVFLEGRALPARIVVGDFYGNPSAAAIDRAERWCVTVGAGLVAYRLGPPWTPYRYQQATDQWFEWGRGPKDVQWITNVAARDDGAFAITTAPDAAWRMEERIVDPVRRSVGSVRQWTDTAGRERAELVRSFVSMPLVEIHADRGSLELRFGINASHRVVVRGVMYVTPAHAEPPEMAQPGQHVSSPALRQLSRLVGWPILRLDLLPGGVLSMEIDTPERAARRATTGGPVHGCLVEVPGRWTLKMPKRELSAPD